MDNIIRQLLLNSYNRRHINDNMDFGLMSKSKIEDLCIKREIQYLNRQNKICNCNHKYSNPEYEYSMYSERLIFVCNLCGYKLIKKIR